MTLIIQNLFENIPSLLPTEITQTIVDVNKVRIERIVSEGQATTEGEWYDQAWDEWVILLSGSARILFDGDAAARILKLGDYVMIPTGCRHRVEWTDPDRKTVWLAVHFGENDAG
jgi:cupin 2 domain-containing protein